jgi:high-affinity Fe2+/Pb2+ permease
MNDDLSPGRQALRDMPPGRRRLLIAGVVIWFFATFAIAFTTHDMGATSTFFVGTIIVYMVAVYVWARFRRSRSN